MISTSVVFGRKFACKRILVVLEERSAIVGHVAPTLGMSRARWTLHPPPVRSLQRILPGSIDDICGWQL